MQSRVGDVYQKSTVLVGRNGSIAEWLRNRKVHGKFTLAQKIRDAVFTGVLSGELLEDP